jgi:hypothetical protein
MVLLFLYSFPSFGTDGSRLVSRCLYRGVSYRGVSYHGMSYCGVSFCGVSYSMASDVASQGGGYVSVRQMGRGGNVQWWTVAVCEPKGLCCFGVKKVRWLLFSGEKRGVCGEDRGGCGENEGNCGEKCKFAGEKKNIIERLPF